MDGPDAGLHAVRSDPARIEGAVAGALGRPFPEFMTRPADAVTAAAE